MLQELFGRRPEAMRLEINPALGRAEIAWRPEAGDLRGFFDDAEKLGYRFGPSRKVEPRRSRNLLIRFAICAAAAMNTMIFSLSFYFGLAPDEGLLYSLFGWLNLGLATVAVAAGGPVFFRGAWEGLRRGVAHLDLPIALGLLLAYGGSVHAQLAHGPRAVYFDAVTVFVTLMVLGRWLQERHIERNRQALLRFEDAGGLLARRFANEAIESVSITDVRVGDELWIAPGDLFPVAGEVQGSGGLVSLDWINGESEPHMLESGARAPGGAFNAGTSTIRIVAVEDFADGSVASLLSGPVATHAEPHAGGWWSRIGAIYVSAVLILASVGFAVWLSHGVERALEVTVSILVVTCPCAIGLATPLAHDLVHGLLRRRGVFVRSGTLFDRALAVRKILFDKTGTLTLGRLRLTDAASRSLATLTDEQRGVLYNMTVRSNHPLSRCITGALACRCAIPVTDGLDIREIAGHGLEWKRGEDVIRFGRWDHEMDSEITRATFSWNGSALASLTFEEELRTDAAREVAALARDGYVVHLLSGDTQARVRTVSRQLGIDASRAVWALTPEAKADRVRQIDEGDTLMIGDGLNDRPSFDAALCAGTPAIDHPALPERADFYFLGDGLAAIRLLLGAAKRLRDVVRTNLAFALVYNVAALALCFAGFMRPVLAAVLMPISSVVIVSITAARLSEGGMRWK
jgi:Cu2+-exporting ATPase